jgi:hypothetical protein
MRPFHQKSEVEKEYVRRSLRAKDCREWLEIPIEGIHPHVVVGMGHKFDMPRHQRYANPLKTRVRIAEKLVNCDPYHFLNPTEIVKLHSIELKTGVTNLSFADWYCSH